MIKYSNIILNFFLIFSCFISPLNIAYAESSKYPETLEERKQDKMGSILGDDGIKFNINSQKTPLKAREKNLKPVNAKSNNNNYMWLAALESVKLFPLNSADYNGSIILTDWVTNSNNSTHRFKISIYIKSQDLSFSSLEVNVYGEEFRRGRWIKDRDKHEFLKSKIKNDILDRAKELAAQGKRSR